MIKIWNWKDKTTYSQEHSKCWVKFLLSENTTMHTCKIMLTETQVEAIMSITLQVF